MKGKIKFVDHKTGEWGFITRDDNREDVYFRVDAFRGDPPWADFDEGVIVEFDIKEAAERTWAVNVRPLVLVGPIQLPKTAKYPGETLSNWAVLPRFPFTHIDGKTYSSAVDLLARLALKEAWQFGEQKSEDGSYPILENYLTYTFHRIFRSKQHAEYKEPNSAQMWASFNTGLVDKLYDPIYALFKRNTLASQPPWRFFDFCIPGKGTSGKQLTSIFDPLPTAAKYFGSNFDMLLDTEKDIHVDYEHVIFDGVSRNRFPPEFLKANMPAGHQWQEYAAMKSEDRGNYLQVLAEAIRADVRCTRAIKNRLEDAKELAEKRTKWNYKTAIPLYHPRFDSMSLLLPLALVDDEVVDIALVITRNPSGSYQGRTILPLHWAYQNARTVCRPDSDWLIPERIHVSAEGGDSDDT
jgi:cold shock CspA family protein